MMAEGNDLYVADGMDTYAAGEQCLTKQTNIQHFKEEPTLQFMCENSDDSKMCEKEVYNYCTSAWTVDFQSNFPEPSESNDNVLIKIESYECTPDEAASHDALELPFDSSRSATDEDYLIIQLANQNLQQVVLERTDLHDVISYMLYQDNDACHVGLINLWSQYCRSVAIGSAFRSPIPPDFPTRVHNQLYMYAEMLRVPVIVHQLFKEPLQISPIGYCTDNGSINIVMLDNGVFSATSNLLTHLPDVNTPYSPTSYAASLDESLHSNGCGDIHCFPPDTIDFDSSSGTEVFHQRICTEQFIHSDRLAPLSDNEYVESPKTSQESTNSKRTKKRKCVKKGTKKGRKCKKLEFNASISTDEAESDNSIPSEMLNRSTNSKRTRKRKCAKKDTKKGRKCKKLEFNPLIFTDEAESDNSIPSEMLNPVDDNSDPSQEKVQLTVQNYNKHVHLQQLQIVVKKLTYAQPCSTHYFGSTDASVLAKLPPPRVTTTTHHLRPPRVSRMPKQVPNLHWLTNSTKSTNSSNLIMGHFSLRKSLRYDKTNVIDKGGDSCNIVGGSTSSSKNQNDDDQSTSSMQLRNWRSSRKGPPVPDYKLLRHQRSQRKLQARRKVDDDPDWEVYTMRTRTKPVTRFAYQKFIRNSKYLSRNSKCEPGNNLTAVVNRKTIIEGDDTYDSWRGKCQVFDGGGCLLCTHRCIPSNLGRHRWIQHRGFENLEYKRLNKSTCPICFLVHSNKTLCSIHYATVCSSCKGDVYTTDCCGIHFTTPKSISKRPKPVFTCPLQRCTAKLPKHLIDKHILGHHLIKKYAAYLYDTFE